ncbi:MAG: hypothetical protein KatS3mg004_3056 [Bryobacteraceae bacterium]|nr:MAG: hypothetical protein KatS3mg004_3056 [Bryobacteraceae bacterium]
MLKNETNHSDRETVLILTEGYTYGGLESHIESEIRSLQGLGYRIGLAVGSRFTSMPPGNHSSVVSLGMPLTTTMTVAHLLECVHLLNLQIANLRPKLIHAHPYISIILALIASTISKVPLAVTLHGPNSIYNHYGSLYRYLLHDILLQSQISIFVVSEELREILRSTAPKAALHVLPNPVTPPSPEEHNTSPITDKILFLGRIDYDKLPGILDFVQKAHIAGLPEIDIFGDGSARNELKKALNSLNLSSYARYKTWTTLPRKEILQYSFVAGMGRSIIEAIALRRYPILVGYDGVKGFLGIRDIRKASFANYSGRNFETVDPQTLRQQFLALRDTDLQELSQAVIERHAEHHVWRRFLALAEGSRLNGTDNILQLYNFLLSAPTVLPLQLLSEEFFNIFRSKLTPTTTAGGSANTKTRFPAQSAGPSPQENAPTTDQSSIQENEYTTESTSCAREDATSEHKAFSAIITPPTAPNKALLSHDFKTAGLCSKLIGYYRSFREVCSEQGILRAIKESLHFILAILLPQRVQMWRASYAAEDYEDLRRAVVAMAENSSKLAERGCERAVEDAIRHNVVARNDCVLVLFSDIDSLFSARLYRDFLIKMFRDKSLIFLRLQFSDPYLFSISENVLETNSVAAALRALSGYNLTIIALSPLAMSLEPFMRLKTIYYLDQGPLMAMIPKTPIAQRDAEKLLRLAVHLPNAAPTEPVSENEHSCFHANGEREKKFQVLHVANPAAPPTSKVFGIVSLDRADERLDWPLLNSVQKKQSNGCLFLAGSSFIVPLGPENNLPPIVADVIQYPSSIILQASSLFTLDSYLSISHSIYTRQWGAGDGVVVPIESTSNHAFISPLVKEPSGDSVPHSVREDNTTLMVDVACNADRLTLEKPASYYQVVHSEKLAVILNATFYDWHGKHCYNGGAERYVIDLADLLALEGYHVLLLQGAHAPFEKVVKGHKLKGIPVKSGYDFRSISIESARFCENAELVIASPVELAQEVEHKRIVGINHGIHWDHKRTTIKSLSRERFTGLLQACTRCSTVVAVDTNFVNWLRTVHYSLSKKVEVIPNYVNTEAFQFVDKDFEGELVCSYPRRLYEARGLYIAAKAFYSILRRHADVRLEFIGQADSPREAQIVRTLQSVFGRRVLWEELEPTDMPKAYHRAHIVLIPTQYSEGTSLSCLEAMASNCGVVASNVGGLPNIVIDGYNGILISPRAGDIISAIEKLYFDRRLLKEIAGRAYEVARSFNIEIWRQRWRRVIYDLP